MQRLTDYDILRSLDINAFKMRYYPRPRYYEIKEELRFLNKLPDIKELYIKIGNLEEERIVNNQCPRCGEPRHDKPDQCPLNHIQRDNNWFERDGLPESYFGHELIERVRDITMC